MAWILWGKSANDLAFRVFLNPDEQVGFLDNVNSIKKSVNLDPFRYMDNREAQSLKLRTFESLVVLLFRLSGWISQGIRNLEIEM